MIEIMAVVVLISIMVGVAAPRISGFLASSGNNMKIFTTVMAKTFDDSFLNGKINYLAIHLSEVNQEQIDSMNEKKDNQVDIFSRKNGLSVLQLKDGVFSDHKKRIFKPRTFSSSFMINSVILSSGERLSRGTVLVPYYPGGYSDNVLIHITIDDDKLWTIKIDKHLKEPLVVKEHVTFNDNE